MEVEQYVRFLGQVRHDFNNHLQVIAGYAELRMHEQLKNYIDTVIEEVAWERELFNSTRPEVALYLFSQILRIKGLDVIARYRDILIDKANSIDILEDKNEPYASVKKCCPVLARCGATPVVYISLRDDGDIIDVLVFNEQMQLLQSSRVNRE